MIFARCTLCRRRLWFRGQDLAFTKHRDRVSATWVPFCEQCIDTRMSEILKWWDGQSA